MCGIAGFVVSGRPPEDPTGVLRSMTTALRHRGPDDEGFHEAPGVHLGHRRLSIIDLGGGHQPIYNEDGQVVTVYNGEIYNFPELKAELEGRGHHFATRSDTEILVHGWEEWGMALFPRLNGMFGAAIWDARTRTLVLARDRFGKKPLYWAETPDGLVFGSELKALMAHPWIRRDLDLASLRKYLVFDYVPGPHSILRGVHKLPAGGLLVWSGGSARVETWWDLRFPEPPAGTEQELADRLWSLMSDAVRARLMSDVPLGVFLSGGIDSSAVVALMAEHLPPERIKTFSIGFRDKTFDESSYARLVATHFGTDHHERILEPESMLDLLPGILRIMDEPLADGSLIPTYMLAGFTRESVTVALGGDGGDELFLGYPTFLAHRAAGLYGRVPGGVHRVARRLAAHLPVSVGNISLDYQIKRFLLGMEYPPEARHFVWIGAIDPLSQPGLLTDDVLAATAGLDLFEDVAAHRARVTPRDDMDALSYLYAKLYMGDDILVKVDRATMAHGLESRAPLLDVRVAEFVASLPTSMKLRGRTMKFLLKRALRGRVPDAVLDRPKKGFGMPIAAWIKGPLLPWVREVLHPDRVRRDGLFRPEAVTALLDAHLAGRADHRKALWSLLVMNLWLDTWGRP
ncbi:MAG: asparagine synthetase B [Myxococcales bacterium]